MKIKTWKVQQINHEMGDSNFFVSVKGQTFGTPIWECEDADGYVTVTNVNGIEKETAKALLLNIGGFKCWCPKSAVIA